MSNNVSLTQSIDDRDVVQAFQKQQRLLRQMEKRLSGVGKAGQRAGRQQAQGQRKAGQSIRDGIAQVGQMAAGYFGVQRAVQAVVRENEQLAGSIDKVLRKLPESQAKLRIQAGLTLEQFEQQLPQLRGVIEKTPAVTDVDTALALQRQLVSSGIREEDVESGRALDAVLGLRAATGQFDQAVEESVRTVQGISSFLKSQGIQEPSAADIRTTGARVTKLFESTEVQSPDLGNLAEEASPLRQLDISRQLQLAAFSVLRDEFQAPRAARGLRLTATRLSAAAASPAKVEALGKAAIEAEGRDPAKASAEEITRAGQEFARNIDLAGETLPEVLGTLKETLGEVSPERQAITLNKLFGEKGQSFAGTLLDKVGTIEERQQLLEQAPETFQQNIERFQKSRAARRQGVRLTGQFEAREADVLRGRLTFQELDNIVETARNRLAAENQGRLPEGAAADFGSVRGTIFRSKLIGETPRDALQRLTQGNFFGLSGTGPAAQTVVDVADEFQQRMTQGRTAEAGRREASAMGFGVRPPQDREQDREREQQGDGDRRAPQGGQFSVPAADLPRDGELIDAMRENAAAQKEVAEEMRQEREDRRRERNNSTGRPPRRAGEPPSRALSR